MTNNTLFLINFPLKTNSICVCVEGKVVFQFPAYRSPVLISFTYLCVYAIKTKTNFQYRVYYNNKNAGQMFTRLAMMMVSHIFPADTYAEREIDINYKLCAVLYLLGEKNLIEIKIMKYVPYSGGNAEEKSRMTNGERTNEMESE